MRLRSRYFYFLFLPVDVQLHLLKWLCLLHWMAFASSSKNPKQNCWAYLCGSISELSIQFHFLSLCQLYSIDYYKYITVPEFILIFQSHLFQSWFNYFSYFDFLYISKLSCLYLQKLMNKCWILSNESSASIDMIFFCLFIWWVILTFLILTSLACLE